MTVSPLASADACRGVPQSFEVLRRVGLTTGAAYRLWGDQEDYQRDLAVAEVDDQNPVGGVRSYAVDADNAERLWSLSERLVGETFAP